ncbi:MAG: methyltransferase domain-containing protein [Gammaproteobacteria bacterium]|nr:methyltransferase domain-containing protein [Gammaproteobacteria bacterium]NIM72732.1 methyltransferase domain-containing protein [Gammaproteobacteria bacterium]NIN38189.1 methyltransferase domain-containing protein [Gammaproteobacteria bacterium]NIO24480.1 methyltransferase domain-containing protein [Gammaproteobacteria bacterium]NIO65089.1 methyltransferase domain-containing protein [Gammaproteobacteria bacterium]
MPRSPEEQELNAHFAEEYTRAQSPVMLDLERAVCGCDYGGTSWTTRDEADCIGALLQLGAGKALLEVGSGSGWPALYLAEKSGCDAILVDLPFEAIRLAADRVAGESLSGAIGVAVGDGAALPVQSASFDAVSHSDVLCCLARKRQVLQECRRVIRPEARMVFSVIYVAAGLSGTDHARAVESGPPHVESECGYPELLEATGWDVVERIDVTAAYEQTGRRHIREVEARADGLKALLGEAEYADMLIRRNRNVEAVAEGIVRRDLFVAKPAEAI